MNYFVLTACVLMVACSPSNTLKPSPEKTVGSEKPKASKTEKEPTKTEKISVAPLVIIDRKDQTDRFIEGLKNQKEQIVFQFPAVQREVVETESVWRVQIGAYGSVTAAEEQLTLFQKNYSIPSEIKTSDQIYKVYVGRSKTRSSLDQLLADLKKAGYGSSWIVQDKIEKQAFPKTTGPYFSIQVGVYTTPLSADQMKKKLESRFKEPIITKHVENLYKVYIGNSKTKEDLKHLQQILADAGYKGWIREITF